MKKSTLLLVLLLAAVMATAQVYPSMVTVEGGTFAMGDEYGTGEPDERPSHRVTLKAFKIARTPTTVLQYREFCRATGREMPQTPDWGWHEDHPMSNVNWEDAVAYCNWLSEKTGKSYRLPTEAEWEYAARGGRRSKGYTYSGGQNMGEVGWYKDNSNGQVQPVAQKKANELGLYDMSGNIWEWCWDWYGKAYYISAPAVNPKGVETGTARVIRGGSWSFVESSCRVPNRGNGGTGRRTINRGFRVALSR